MPSPPGPRASLTGLLALTAGVLALFVAMVRPFLLSLLLGEILAVLSTPLHSILTRRRWGPRLAAAAVVLTGLLAVGAPLAAFGAAAVAQGQELARSVAEENDGLTLKSASQAVAERAPFAAVRGKADVIERRAREALAAAGGALSRSVLVQARGVPEFLLKTALVVLAWFFMLVDGARLRTWSFDKLPVDADVRADLTRTFHDTAASVIWATLAAATAQAAVIFAGFQALGVPASFLAAGATFIFAWIPIVGSTPAWAAAAAYLFAKGLTLKGALMLAIGAFTGLVDNFIRPLILKGRADLHPLLALVAIFGGIRLFGIIGVFVGPIVAAALVSLLDAWSRAKARTLV